MSVVSPKLSIVVPTYNEAGNIDRVLLKLYENFKDVPFEIVVIDGGSTDGTVERAVEVKRSLGIPVLIFRQRVEDGGKPQALLEGFEYSKGEYVGTIDADLEYSPADLRRLFDLAVKEDLDVAYGAKIDRRPLRRRVISRGAKLLAKFLVPEAANYADPISELYVVKKDVLIKCRSALKPRIKPFLEIVVKCKPQRHGYIKIHQMFRTSGESKFKPGWIVDYLVQLLEFTNYYPLRYIAGALVALPVSLALWPHLGLAAPILAALVKWAFIWRDVGPATTIGVKALALALKLTEAATWYVTAPLEFLVLTALRKRSPI